MVCRVPPIGSQRDRRRSPNSKGVRPRLLPSGPPLLAAHQLAAADRGRMTLSIFDTGATGCRSDRGDRYTGIERLINELDTWPALRLDVHFGLRTHLAAEPGKDRIGFDSRLSRRCRFQALKAKTGELGWIAPDRGCTTPTSFRPIGRLVGARKAQNRQPRHFCFAGIAIAPPGSLSHFYLRERHRARAKATAATKRLGLLFGRFGECGGGIVQDRAKPALNLRHAHVLARCIILDLVALDLGDAEIVAVRMRQIEPGDG
jgi:hypothetical protein